jgi:hypothetical protein
MMFAAAVGHRSGRATPSLRGAPQRQSMEIVRRETIYRNRNAVQTNPATSTTHDSKEEDWITIGSRDNSVVHAHGRGMTSVFPCVRVQLSPLLTAVLFREDRIPKLRGTPTNLASMADRERS